MYFPTADITVSPFIPLLAAFAISFFASMGGISGAFLLLPFQMSFLGYTNPSVSATNQFYNVLAIPSGVYRYIQEKRMVWPLAFTVATGTLPGVFLGALARVAWLPDPGPFKFFAGCVLLYIGGQLIKDLLKLSLPFKRASASHAVSGNRPVSGFTVEIREFSPRCIAYTFQDKLYTCPTLGIFALSFVVGIVGGVYGIGGGAIIAPFFVSWFKLPIHSISGATLTGTFLTSIAGMAFYTAVAPLFPEQSVTPDWLLGFFFGVGGMAGMYLGAHCQKYVPALLIKWALAVVITGTALSYLLEFF